MMKQRMRAVPTAFWGVLILGALISNVSADTPPDLAEFWTPPAIEGCLFSNSAPALISGDLPVLWSLEAAPTGMVINSETGELAWEDPVIGTWAFSIVASNAFGFDALEWTLRVLTNAFPAVRIYSTRHVDFVVPAEIYLWMQKWSPSNYVDKAYERMWDILGDRQPSGRQIVLYDPSSGGGASSGIIVHAGPGFWSTNDVRGWVLGAWDHEVGHNFHGRTRIAEDILPSDWRRETFHHFMELTQMTLADRVITHPTHFGLAGTALSNYVAWCASRDEEIRLRYTGYPEWVAAGGSITNYSGDKYAVGAHIARELCRGFSTRAVEDTVRLMRGDGMPRDLFASPLTDLEAMALVVAAVSASASEDARPLFQSWGIPFDNDYYTNCSARVEEAFHNLPFEDGRGWKYCPLNGHYYTITPWPMPWDTARRHALRLGGQLVTIRSREEEQWLISRYGLRDSSFWAGLTDEGSEGTWTWLSGEPLSYTNWNPLQPVNSTQHNSMCFYSGPPAGWDDQKAANRHQAIIERLSMPPCADLDNDGLPDWWETRNFDLYTDSSAATDPDGDGHDNSAEYVAGTSPVDGTSVFSFAGLAPQMDGCCVITWPSTERRAYDLLWAPSITGQWHNLASNLPATTPMNTYTSSVLSGVDAVFLRGSVRIDGE